MKYLRSFAVGIFETSGCDGWPRAVDDLPDRLETVWLCDADDMAAVVLSNFHDGQQYQARNYIDRSSRPGTSASAGTGFPQKCKAH